jgi:nucleoid DNA-binding protein
MMIKYPFLILGLSLAMSGEPLILSGQVQSQRPPKEETLPEKIARMADVKEAEANKILAVLGTAVQEELAKGREVTFPALGTFRVVRIEEHKDLYQGRPVTVPAVNAIEFLPAGGLTTAANSARATPAETVPEFRYTPLPNQTPGQRVGPTRTPSTRVR